MTSPPVMCHHEWGVLKEAIVGISPADGFVIPHWYDGLCFMGPQFKRFAENFGGQRLLDVDPKWANAIEREVEGFAELLASLGVIVHRPTRLEPLEATYLTPAAEGAQLYPRDPVLVIGEQIIEINIRMPWRRRETFGVRSVVQPIAEQHGAPWAAMPMPSLDPLEDEPPASGSGRAPDHVSPLLEGGDTLLNGYDVYVGLSGLASNRTGIAWLQRHLGPDYRVHEVPIERHALHLDTVVSLLGPDLGIICRSRLLEQQLPPGLEHYRWIEATEDEAEQLGCNSCVLDEQRVVVPDHLTRIIGEIERHGVEVIQIPYHNVALLGGALRCSHHPLVRVSDLGPVG